MVGGSRFKPVNGVVLEPVAYTIVAYGYGGRERNGNSSDVGTTNAAIGAFEFVGGSRFGAAQTYPDQAAGGPANRYGAGTFHFNVIDPSPLATPLGEWSGKLRDSGERVSLRDAQGHVVDQLEYGVGFPWAIADNDQTSNWHSGVRPTPGVANSVTVDNLSPTVEYITHSPGQLR